MQRIVAAVQYACSSEENARRPLTFLMLQSVIFSCAWSKWNLLSFSISSVLSAVTSDSRLLVRLSYADMAWSYTAFFSLWAASSSYTGREEAGNG